MRLEITLNGQQQAVVLEGRGTVGGADDDTVRISNAPGRLVELWPEGPVWRLKTRVAGKVNGVAFPAHVSRIFMALEVVELPGGMSLRHLPVAEGAVGTAAVLKDLLGEPEALAPSLPVFICLTGADSGRRFSLTGSEALIGRGDGCQVQLRDGSVSRRHCKVERLGSKFWIEDLDSPNGVFLNGRRMSRRAVLADGVVIEVGQSLLRFQAPADNKPARNSGATPNMPAPAQQPPRPPADALEQSPSSKVSADGGVEAAKDLDATPRSKPAEITKLPPKTPTTVTPTVPMAAEPAPVLHVVDGDPDPTPVNEPPPPLGLREYALIAGGVAMMVVGGVVALVLS